MPAAGGFGSAHFPGNREELRKILAWAAHARADGLCAILVQGGAGTGKTALLRRALTELNGFTRLWADCPPTASRREFAAVDQLLRATPAPPAAWAAARRTGPGLLAFLEAAQQSGPVVIGLDDVHRMDGPSATALAFALRGLRSVGILAIATTRERRGSGPAVEADVERLYLALLESGRSRVVHLAGIGPRDTADPSGHPDAAVLHAVAALAALAAPSQRLLAAMAVLDSRQPLATVAAVAGVDEPCEALEPLLDTGLVRWFPDEPSSPVEIGNTLYRDLVYRSLPPVQRRILHLAAAERASGMKAWGHRAAGYADESPLLADALERESARYHLAGDVERAGALLLWSADITSARAQRERRLLQATGWLLSSHKSSWTTALRSRLESCGPSAARDLYLGLIEEAAGRYARARILLTGARELAGADAESAGLRPAIDVGLAFAHKDLGDAPAAYRAARAVLDTPDVPADIRDWAEYLAADAFGRMNGGPSAALRELASDVSVRSNAVPRSPERDAFLLLWARGVWRAVTGQLHDAGDDLDRVLRSADRETVSAVGPAALAYLAYTRFLLGDWNSAERTCAQALEAAQGHLINRLTIAAHAVSACVSAGRGDWSVADHHAQAARRRYEESGPDTFAAFPAVAAATLAQAQADPGRMLAALHPVIARPLHAVDHQAWWRPLQVEALIGAGRLAEAQGALADLRVFAAGGARLEPTLAWLEAWLGAARGDPAAARARFEDAVDGPVTADDVPFHRARLEHDYGRFLISTRHRKPAIGWLRRAHDRYVSLGAIPYAERCARDLEACGVWVFARRTAASSDRSVVFLTAQERRIVYLVAQGLTNQEVAHELFVSHKTVEYHLGNVFAKLGITSRRQLRARLDAMPPSVEGGAGLISGESP